MELGAHVSAAGSVAKAPERGQRIGCDCIQVFTRNQRQWRARPVTPDEAAEFRGARAAHGIGAAVAHASYLINLAAPEAGKRQRSIEAMAAELTRCHQLGIERLVVHPGAHRDAGLEAGIRRIADSLNRVARAHPDKADVSMLLENVAGQGTTIGSRFQELAAILERLEEPTRFAICVDTAHAFAAGYALHTEAGWDAMWDAFDRHLGLNRLSALHANDSKAPHGSRKDRHALLGRGYIGAAAFQRVVRDRRTVRVPIILETPGGPAGWAQEIQWLRGAAAGELPALPDIAEAATPV